jgi:tRNA(Arg) A34 adenosine deaminase TadA
MPTMPFGRIIIEVLDSDGRVIVTEHDTYTSDHALQAHIEAIRARQSQSHGGAIGFRIVRIGRDGKRVQTTTIAPR